MIAFFIEPPSAVAPRPATTQPLPFSMVARSISSRPQPHHSPKAADDFWTKLVFETLNPDDEPVRITTIVNEVVAWGNFTKRSEREAKKIELFKLTGKLIRMGRLQRVGRRYVTIPASDEKYHAYLAGATAHVDLPEPRV